MAKTNETAGLYLPLRINLDEWEQQLSEANVDLQRAMNEMHGAMKDLKFQYDIEIAGAKAAGNDIKVLQLQNAKLNQVYAEQKRAVEALNNAYEKSVQEKGKDAKATQDLAKQLVRESKELDKIQRQIDAKGFNFGKKLSDSLADVSPEFARIRSMVAGATESLSSMGGSAIAVAKAVGGIGVAFAGLGAVYTGMEKIVSEVDNIAEAGKKASDPIYQLRESLQSTYEDAEYLYRVTSVDGSNAESLANSLTKLVSTLKKDEDGTNSATIALREYGAELFDAEGNAKSYREMLVQLSAAAQKAAQAGRYADFKSALPGAFRSTEFDHLLLGLDGYAEKAEKATIKAKIFYDLLHETGDLKNALELTKQQGDAILGGAYSEASIKNLKLEIENAVAVNKLLDKNNDKYRELANEIGTITASWIQMKGSATLVWESVKKDIAGGVKELEKFVNIAKWVYAINPANLVGGSVLDYFRDKFGDAKKQLDEAKKEIDAETKVDTTKVNTNVSTTVNKKNDKEAEKRAKQEEQAEQKRLEAVKRFERELRDLRASDYEREINQLNDRVEAWRKEKIDEVAIAERASLEKEAIDKKYTEKRNAELARETKIVEDNYKKQLESAKKLRESTISDAQRTIESNLKILRYLQKNDGDIAGAKEYAQKLYMRQSGVRQQDIDTAQRYGIDMIKDISNISERLFGRFADVQQQQPVTNNNNSVTINNTFDGTVVEDVTAMDRLANRVAEIITPAIEQAIRGGTQYGY